MARRRLQSPVEPNDPQLDSEASPPDRPLRLGSESDRERIEPAELEGMTWFGYIGFGIALAALLISVVLMVAGCIWWVSVKSW